ncbi:MAG: maltose alpha-D-glucosyltransferase [Candidatus Omnitrophica bacterium]|nr:maltose alpha-D-glucosyltransferase [Candidatus Omnitrophota bacterium]
MPKKYFEVDPLWYKDAIIYELHVRAFFDSNNDGIGDFRGLIGKLDYLEGLGVTALWLLPFYPSPLKDDGYDIADYCKVHPDYGTLKDFKDFVQAAHERGIRVITELVLNHTSSEHQWFQKARRAKPGTTLRNRYVWSDSPEKYADARIIFKDFEQSNWSWDAVAHAYYWHRFYSHQPDLNFDDPVVQQELLRVVDFWFDMGVDGLRLDAVPYLFEQEGTNCENLPETHGFLKKLRAHVDSTYKDKMLLAEANQWPEDAAAYFGTGNECHMAFHFPLMPRMFMAVQMEDNFPIIDIFKSTPAIPDICQWAMFLRNHDELTLEMVTDEERDYMYRFYASDPRAKINVGIRRRLAPLLGNNVRKIELMNILLFSLPGTPVLYYGDEIGMGDNYYLGDRNGVRSPIQWSSDRNAGFSRANPQQLYLPVIIDPDYHYESINIESQERNMSSFLWWMKRVISMRKRFRAFSRGRLEMLPSDNAKVLTFIRAYEDEIILVVANISRFSQVVTLNLSAYTGYVPEEVFSENQFPVIRKTPYTITLGPYTHFWLYLKKIKEEDGEKTEKSISEISVSGEWYDVFKGKNREKLESVVLAAFLMRSRWFGGKARKIRSVKIVEFIPVAKDSSMAYVLFLDVRFHDGVSDVYVLPVSFCSEDHAQHIQDEFPQSIIAHVTGGERWRGVLFDSVYDSAFQESLFMHIKSRRRTKGLRGHMAGSSGKQLQNRFQQEKGVIGSHVLKGEQSNTSIIYNKKGILKLYRHLEEGINPDFELTRALTEKTSFSHIAPYLGSLEYVGTGGSRSTVGLMQEFVDNVGDGWRYTQDFVKIYYEQVLSQKAEGSTLPTLPLSLSDITIANIPTIMRENIGELFLEMVTLLGKRTAELHMALASITDSEDFKPETFSVLYQRSVYQSVESQIHKTMQLLSRSLKKIPKTVRPQMEDVVAQEKTLSAFLKTFLKKKIKTMKIRIHGDYHLGQVLYTGNDFVIIDFEGEPSRPLSERRLKYSPFRDVAGMIRSFHYAAYSILFLRSTMRLRDIPLLQQWAEPWYTCVSGVFLHSYLDTARESPFVPKDKDEIDVLLKTFLIHKAMYEVGYEINNRPEWLIVPVKGLQQIMKDYV